MLAEPALVRDSRRLGLKDTVKALRMQCTVVA